VDDNETNRRILRHQLVAWKMRHGSAASGYEALQLLRTAVQEGRPYDMALIDMQMPHMSGMDLSRAIKAEPAIAGTRIIILTSMGDLLKKEDLLAQGIHTCLVKPVKQSRLFDSFVSTLGINIAQKKFAKLVSETASPNPVRPMHILLAEDNLVNQKVALAQLRALGLNADVAKNGKEVLKALEYSTYDVILMDCQMPEMDGYEATQLIRQISGPKSKVRIIAMTANAMSGDREKCLAAGMDDYLSKPVHGDELQIVLSRSQSQS
jgi:CheY-like chemotaxis protein